MMYVLSCGGVLDGRLDWSDYWRDYCISIVIAVSVDTTNLLPKLYDCGTVCQWLWPHGRDKETI